MATVQRKVRYCVFQGCESTFSARSRHALGVIRSNEIPIHGEHARLSPLGMDFDARNCLRGTLDSASLRLAAKYLEQIYENARA